MNNPPEDIGAHDASDLEKGIQPDLCREKNPGQECQIQGTETEQPPELLTKTMTQEFSTYGPWSKKGIVFLASVGAAFSPFTTNIYYPALTDMARDLNVSITKINLTITTYMVLQGLAPSFIGNWADTVGRRPAYVVGFLIYVASNVGLGLNNSYIGLLVLRCVQSCGSSGLATLKTAVIADVVTSAERGSYIAFTSVGSIIAPSLAPIAGGLISENLGWHWIFWILVIISGVFFIPLIAFFPETCRRIVGDGSVLPPKWNRSVTNIIADRRRRKAGLERPESTHPDIQGTTKSRFPNPWDTISLMAEKETAMLLGFQSIIYAGYYAISTTITTRFTIIYGLSASKVGLVFLPLAASTICAAFTNGRLLDANYRRHAKRVGIPVEKKKQIDLAGFPLERTRLEFCIPMFAVSSCAVLAYGWLLDFKLPLAAPIVFLFIIGYTAMCGFSTMSVLLIDIHRRRAATASAASNLTRCLLGAGASAVVNPVIEAMSIGWCFTFVAFVWLASIPMLLAIIKWGPGWRKEMADKKRKAEEKTKENQLGRGD